MKVNFLTWMILGIFICQLPARGGVPTPFPDANPANACDLNFFSCDYTTVDPCPKLIKQYGEHPTKENVGADQTASLCYMMKADATACNASWPIAAAYTAAAAICLSTCVFPVLAPVGGPACSVGSLGAAGMDFVESMRVKNSSDTFKEKAAGFISSDWGFAPGTANLLGQGLWNAGTFFLGGGLNITANAAMEAGTAGHEAWMSTYDKAYNAASESAKSFTGSAAENAAKESVEPAAKQVADQAAEKASQEASNKASSTAACYEAAIDAVMAAIHVYDYRQIIGSAGDQCRNMKTLTMPTNSPQAGLTPSSYSGIQDSAPPPNPSARNQSLEALKKKTNDMANSGQLAQSFATGEIGRIHGHPSPDAFNKAMQALKDRFGVTPGDLAASAARDGVAATLSKLLGNSPQEQAAKDMLDQIDKDTQAFLKANQNQLAFSSGGSSGGSSRKTASSGGGMDISGLFGGLGKQQGSANSGASAIQFGGFAGDIWHAGTTKTIFDIVSDKTHAVSNRVE